MKFGRSGGVQGHGMVHTRRFPRTLTGFGLTWHRGSRFSCFWEILETHFITKYLQIVPRASRLVLGLFGEWRTRYLLGVAHTIFFGCGAHDAFLAVAHTVFLGCGAHGLFWVWRTRFVLGVAHMVFVGCGAHDTFWAWRTLYFLGVAHTIFLEMAHRFVTIFICRVFLLNILVHPGSPWKFLRGFGSPWWSPKALSFDTKDKNGSYNAKNGSGRLKKTQRLQKKTKNNCFTKTVLLSIFKW